MTATEKVVENVKENMNVQNVMDQLCAIMEKINIDVQNVHLDYVNMEQVRYIVKYAMVHKYVFMTNIKFIVNHVEVKAYVNLLYVKYML